MMIIIKFVLKWHVKLCGLGAFINLYQNGPTYTLNVIQRKIINFILFDTTVNINLRKIKIEKQGSMPNI